MNKLKVKVFATIFIILSLFVSLLILVNCSRTYYDKKSAVKDVLQRMSVTSNRLEREDSFNPVRKEDDFKQDNARKIYLDFFVYTILLEDDGSYKGIINNTFSENIDEEKIKELAEKIIAHKKTDVFVGNLYVNKYAYMFTRDNSLIIMDNTNINEELRKNLSFNIIIFVFSEIIICILTYYLTKWIITPVKTTFLKQKQFVEDASHELKTPLSVIVASLDAYFNDKDEKWICNIRNEAGRMTKLVTDLLDLADSEKDVSVVMQEEELSTLVESTILTFESVFYEKNIKLAYEIENDIKLVCNEAQIKQLMGILLDNAIKHSKKKGLVEINLYKNNKAILLEVKNKGEAINKGEEEKIFERFYKGDISRNRDSNNYGLGLAIAKNIVENNNGSISASSNNGITTFKVKWSQK